MGMAFLQLILQDSKTLQYMQQAQCCVQGTCFLRGISASLWSLGKTSQQGNLSQLQILQDSKTLQYMQQAQCCVQGTCFLWGISASLWSLGKTSQQGSLSQLQILLGTDFRSRIRYIVLQHMQTLRDMAQSSRWFGRMTQLGKV